DGKGSAGWEYSTKRWDYDKREIFVSDRGTQAVLALQRDVPPNVTRLEDVRGTSALINSHDLLTALWWQNIQLYETTGEHDFRVMNRAIDMMKARYWNGGTVRHTVPDNGSPLLIRH